MSTGWADANNTLSSGEKNSESTRKMLEPLSYLERRMTRKLTQGLTRLYEVNRILV